MRDDLEQLSSVTKCGEENIYNKSFKSLAGDITPHCRHTSIHKINSEMTISRLSCSENRIICEVSEHVDENMYKRFSNIFESIANDELQIQEIGDKNYAPDLCGRNDGKANNQFSADDEQNIIAKIANFKSANEEKAQTVISSHVNPQMCFRTAKEELDLQNGNKNQTSTTAQNNNRQKRVLGIRRGVRSKFVSPMLSNCDR